jgi:hypothetical protein
MAEVTNVNAAVVAGNGLGPTTHVVSVTDVSAVSVAAVITEATTGDANDNVFTVAGVEGTDTDGDMILLQGSATPDLTGAVVEATFTQNPA